MADLHLHNYQDELDNDPNAVDTFTQAQNDDLVADTGKPAGELRQELNRTAIDEHDTSGDPEDEDMREAVEDLDEDPEDNK